MSARIAFEVKVEQGRVARKLDGLALRICQQSPRLSLGKARQRVLAAFLIRRRRRERKKGRG